MRKKTKVNFGKSVTAQCAKMQANVYCRYARWWRHCANFSVAWRGYAMQWPILYFMPSQQWWLQI